MGIRGFLLQHRVTTLISRRVCRKRSSSAMYRHLNRPNTIRVKPFSRLLSWTRRFRAKAKAIVSKNLDSGLGYIQVGQERDLSKSGRVPKGHLAVYVGQKDGDFQRVFVPVVYFNHPLFGNLLKESEKEYGFDHSGGITIPCCVSEFERVQSRIKSVQRTRTLLGWKRSN